MAVSRRNRIAKLTYLFLLLLPLSGCSDWSARKTPPLAEKGVLDLRQWDFEKDGPVQLKGTWEFHWKQLLTPRDFVVGTGGPEIGGTASAVILAPDSDFIQAPGRWNDHVVDGKAIGGPGFATYRLRILLPATAANLAVAVPDAYSSHRTFWNGVEIGSAGVVGNDADSSVPFFVPIIATASPGSESEIVMHVANFFHRNGGAASPVSLGRAADLLAGRDRRRTVDSFLAGALLLMGLYHVGLFFYRKKDKAALWFGLLCLIVTMRLLVTGERLLVEALPQPGFSVFLKLEYLTLYAGVPVTMLFFHALFPHEFSRRIRQIFIALASAASAAVLALPAALYTHTLASYQIFVLLCTGYALGVTIFAARHARQGARMILIGWIIFAITVVNDILYHQFLIGSGFLAPVGLFAFTFAQAGALSRRIATAFNTSEELSAKLEVKVDERTRELEAARDRSESDRRAAEAAREESARLAQFSRKINESTDLDMVLREIFAHIQTTFGARDIVVQMVDEAKQELYTVSCTSLRTPDKLDFMMQLRVPLNESGGTLFRTFRRQKPFYAPRIAGFPSDLDRMIVEAFKLESLGQFPLVIQKRTIGILWLSFGSERRPLSDIESIGRLCEQIAGAIYGSNLLREVQEERARAEKASQESENARQETEILADLARKANQGDSIDAILTHLLHLIEQRFGANSMSLFTVDTASGALTQRSGFYMGQHLDLSHYPEAIRIVPLSPSGGMLYRTYRKQKISYAPRINHERLKGSPMDEAFVRTFNVAWVVHAPLIVDGDVIAIFAITGTETRESLSKADLQFVERVAAQVAGAVRATLLLQQTEIARAESEKAREETAILAELARRANQASDLDQLISHVHDVVKKRYGAGQLALYALDRSANKLVLRGGVARGGMGRVADYDLIIREVPLIESSGTLFQAFKRARTLYLPAIRPAHLEFSAVDRALWNAWKFPWAVDIPLTIENEVVGILALSGMPVDENERDKSERHARLKRADLAFCERIAAQVAGSVRAAELLQTAEAARAESDTLLNNVLPASVAAELKREGAVEPLFFDAVSVLFTDFVGFTKASEKMMPHELVEELDGCFTQFDAVVKRNNMEKLKTIGDSYMCAAGVPKLSATHAVDACLTALEFRTFMHQLAEVKQSLGVPVWQLRIGIHSGPVTAGVIGTNKFAYDIWGDTVNTASRMESSGVPEKVNISGDTYALVKDFFDCEYRGKIHAKGKGEIDMYFLQRIKPGLSADDAGLLPNGKFEVKRIDLRTLV